MDGPPEVESTSFSGCIITFDMMVKSAVAQLGEILGALEELSMWHHLYIDNPDTALATSRRMMEAVVALLAASENNDVALFSRLDHESGGVHYYFTPQTQSVAVAFGASACEKPSKQVAGGLLVGDQTIIERAF